MKEDYNKEAIDKFINIELDYIECKNGYRVLMSFNNDYTDKIAISGKNHKQAVGSLLKAINKSIKEKYKFKSNFRLI